MLRPSMGLIACLLACACGGDGTAGTDTDPTTGTDGTGDLPTTPGDPGTSTGITAGPTTAGPTTDEPTTVGPDTTGTPTACDANPVCEGPGSCGECSLADTCSAAQASCAATPGDECNAYLQCEADCMGGEPCVRACGLAYPGGYVPAWALTDCMRCSACPTSCAATAGPYCGGGGGGPGKIETCDQIADCGLCSLCTVDRGCAAAVRSCAADPQCQAYQACFQGCAEDDPACQDICQEMYPGGYTSAWAQYDCAVCDECPTACPQQQPYCAAGGGGPDNECASNADCVELYDALPFCVDQQCVQCLSDDNCLERGASICEDGFCV